VPDGSRGEVVMNGPKRITAKFGPAYRRVLVRRTGRGIVRIGPTSCRASRCVTLVRVRETVTLRANPARGWRFKQWARTATEKASAISISTATRRRSRRSSALRRRNGRAEERTHSRRSQELARRATTVLAGDGSGRHRVRLGRVPADAMGALAFAIVLGASSGGEAHQCEFPEARYACEDSRPRMRSTTSAGSPAKTAAPF
jgi:hypothetical protein